MDDLSSFDGGEGNEADVLDGFVSDKVVLVHLEHMPQEDKITISVPFGILLMLLVDYGTVIR